jgi:nucleotide-binding universal stress UspA family protein
VWGLGDPVSEILRVADERQAGAIVVGTHHHSALGRLFGTDTAADLVREAHCDVLVAR